MKLVTLALSAAIANAQLENCLYCMYTDERATFLESWSYCAAQTECLADERNYIDRPCEGGWKRGNELSLFQCETAETACPEFVSTKQYDLNEPLGKHKNITWTLPAGTQCTVKIDATEYVGRVLFDGVQGNLGIEPYDPLYDFTEKISFPQGQTGEILIYNAMETGPLRFTISFSGAK